MELAKFLSATDAQHAQTTLAKLRHHGLDSLALTGGFAIELQLLRRGFPVGMRPLNDIDFLADTFGDIPATLSRDFIFRHVHPHDPPGKTLLQSVDPETAVRVDVFRAYGREMERAQAVEIDGIRMRMVALEDLIARAARLCLDFAFETPMPAKHARDFLRLAPLADAGIEAVWQDHRKPNHPASFAEAEATLAELIPSRKDLQIDLEYSRDVHRQCSRCEATDVFPLADGERVVALLGYC